MGQRLFCHLIWVRVFFRRTGEVEKKHFPSFPVRQERTTDGRLTQNRNISLHVYLVAKLSYHRIRDLPTTALFSLHFRKFLLFCYISSWCTPFELNTISCRIINLCVFRACGQVFCRDCSKQRVPLPQFGYMNPERVCENCFQHNDITQVDEQVSYC